jgi:hypothetical protein
LIQVAYMQEGIILLHLQLHNAYLLKTLLYQKNNIFYNKVHPAMLLIKLFTYKYGLAQHLSYIFIYNIIFLGY